MKFALLVVISFVAIAVIVIALWRTRHELDVPPAVVDDEEPMYESEWDPHPLYCSRCETRHASYAEMQEMHRGEGA